MVAGWSGGPQYTAPALSDHGALEAGSSKSDGPPSMRRCSRRLARLVLKGAPRTCSERGPLPAQACRRGGAAADRRRLAAALPTLLLAAAGHVKRVRCESSAAMVPKDKAIKRFIVRNMVDASAIRDLQDACAIDGGCRHRCLLCGRGAGCTASAAQGRVGRL